MNWPVMTELATFQCLLTSSVSFSNGVAPRSVKSLPCAAEPTRTSLPRKSSRNAFVWPSNTGCPVEANFRSPHARVRVILRQPPINVKLTISVHRNHPLDIVRPAQGDATRAANPHQRGPDPASIPARQGQCPSARRVHRRTVWLLSGCPPKAFLLLMSISPFPSSGISSVCPSSKGRTIRSFSIRMSFKCRSFFAPRLLRADASGG